MISGVLSKIDSGLITVKTPTVHYTISSTAIHAVCRVDHKGNQPTPHHLMIGNLTYANPDKRQVRLWTPEGVKTYAPFPATQLVAGIPIDYVWFGQPYKPVNRNVDASTRETASHVLPKPSPVPSLMA